MGTKEICYLEIRRLTIPGVGYSSDWYGIVIEDDEIVGFAAVKPGRQGSDLYLLERMVGADTTLYIFPNGNNGNGLPFEACSEVVGRIEMPIESIEIFKRGLRWLNEK